MAGDGRVVTTLAFAGVVVLLALEGVVALVVPAALGVVVPVGRDLFFGSGLDPCLEAVCSRKVLYFLPPLPLARTALGS